MYSVNLKPKMQNANLTLTLTLTNPMLRVRFPEGTFLKNRYLTLTLMYSAHLCPLVTTKHLTLTLILAFALGTYRTVVLKNRRIERYMVVAS